MLSSAGLGHCLVAQIQNVELVAGVPSYAFDSNRLGGHVRSSWVRALESSPMSLIGRHRAGRVAPFGNLDTSSPVGRRVGARV